MPASERLRVLVIAEAANPEWVSVPLVGWSHARAIAKQVDAHVVTQVRNQAAFLRAGLREPDEFTAINSDKIGEPLYKLSKKLRGGSNKAWTVTTAINAFSYYYFEHLVWKQFGRDIKAKRFDVVHRVTPLSPTAASTIAKKCHRAGVPFVLGPLNGGLPWPAAFDKARRQEREWLSYVRSAYKLLPGYGSTRKYAAAIIAGSMETYRQIPKRYHGKCVYIPENAIFPERFDRVRTHTAQRPIRLVFLGRLVPYKGADMLLEAAAPLVRAGSVTIDILGDGPDMPKLREIVARETIEPNVRLHGWVAHSDVPAIIAGCDVFAFPSIREFGGGAVIEAMAVGLVPVIVDYGGPGELVTPRTGFKIPIGTRDEIVARLREVLANLVENPAIVDQKSRAALERAHTLYTWDAKAAQTVEVYRWVLGQRSKPDWNEPMPDLPATESASSASHMSDQSRPEPNCASAESA